MSIAYPVLTNFTLVKLSEYLFVRRPKNRRAAAGSWKHTGLLQEKHNQSSILKAVVALKAAMAFQYDGHAVNLW